MNKPANKKETKKEIEFVEVTDIEVLKVHQFKNGNVSADLKINGITIYGVMVVETKKGDFLSFPQRAGSDGKYYSIVWCPLAADIQADVIKIIEDKLAEK